MGKKSTKRWRITSGRENAPFSHEICLPLAREIHCSLFYSHKGISRKLQMEEEVHSSYNTNKHRGMHSMSPSDNGARPVK